MEGTMKSHATQTFSPLHFFGQYLTPFPRVAICPQRLRVCRRLSDPAHPVHHRGPGRAGVQPQLRQWPDYRRVRGHASRRAVLGPDSRHHRAQDCVQRQSAHLLDFRDRRGCQSELGGSGLVCLPQRVWWWRKFGAGYGGVPGVLAELQAMVAYAYGCLVGYVTSISWTTLR